MGGARQAAGTTRRGLIGRGAALPLALPALGCALADPRHLATLPPPPSGSIPLKLVSRDWHTEIAVPVDLLDAPTRQDWLAAVPIAYRNRIAPRQGHVAFGFGAKVFMTAASPGVEEALAALMQAPGVIAVSGTPARPQDLSPPDDEAEVKVTPEGLRHLLRFVRDQVERDEAGRPALVGGGLFRGRSLFDSWQRYSAAFTCNTWTLQALRAAGLPVEPDGVVWSRQVMRQARRIAAAQAG